MASLSNLISSRISNLAGNETNLERGEITVFYPGTMTENFRCQICWKPPRRGVAEIEIWGAGGSSPRQCCCAAGVPGNPGAYVKKTVEVSPDSFVAGTVGYSCGNAGALCFRGCSESTCITICHLGGCTCLCAEGGSGGRNRCHTGGSIACCIQGTYGLPSHQLPNAGNGCRMLCNLNERGRAFGGDINCNGGFSCSSFYHCNGCCAESFYDHVAVPPGIMSKDGAVLTINRDSNRDQALLPGTGVFQTIGALNLAGRSPTLGGHFAAAWAGSRGCSCYEMWGCIPMMPYGVPGTGVSVCVNVRNSGYRGGHGAVRIKFIGS